MAKRPLSVLLAVPILFVAPRGFVAAQTSVCDQHSVSAGAVRTPEEVEAFVNCAAEFVQEVGFKEAHRAFHEDERWRKGASYIFVSEHTPLFEQTLSLVFPPNRAREAIGATDPDPARTRLLSDAFGNNYYQERYRILSLLGEGWIYYAFTNPSTGMEEPKASYVKLIDWDGIPAAIGSGIYRRDLPGTCRRAEVNAAVLGMDPSNRRLQEFVRCAAMEVEAMGYFASISLSADPRWRHDSIYVFGVDGNGNTLFSGDPYRRGGWTLGGQDSELTSLADRDDLSVAQAFGETFLYYMSRNPATGVEQRKVVFVKRVVIYGLPILIGSGYYSDE